MAEINIEPKKRSGWAWVIVVLVLILVAWLLYVYVFRAEGGDPETMGAPTAGLVLPVALILITP